MTALIAGAMAAVFALAPAPSSAQQRIERELRVDGRSRSYIAILPENVSSGKALRVMMAFHPALGTADFMEKTTRLHKAKGANNFITVYPDGFRRTWNAGDCCGLAEKRNIDDIGFFKAIMADLSTIAPIQKKAYITGYSNGAVMVYQLVCKVPGLVAAAAPFAATHPMKNCASGAVPLMHMHGASDQGSPVEGGYAKSAAMKKSLGYMTPAAEVVAIVAKRNGCTNSTTKKSEGSLGTTCTFYNQCNGNANAILCVIPKLGHTWPGAEEAKGAMGDKFGPARPDLNGSRAVVNFFLNH
ncbi:alpha/beta hydrolase family esterase [Actibacterium lipolyticum]|uniref:alpha/beta hydrolase family esterase n=1 Tax=Actibacterium lipolyticum TaxID=1524263 RepID=UPI000BB453C6|nr:hypothetical protein [Actibacterium lipolyticum]